MPNLKDGLYKLSRAVKNPKGDKRANRRFEADWRLLSEWKEGRLFYIKSEPSDVAPGVMTQLIESKSGGAAPYCTIHRVPQELLDALVPAEAKNILQAFRVAGVPEHQLPYAVDQLVREGKLTHRDILEASDREMKRESKDDVVTKVIRGPRR